MDEAQYEDREAPNLLRYAVQFDHPEFGKGWFFSPDAVESLVSDVRRPSPVTREALRTVLTSLTWIDGKQINAFIHPSLVETAIDAIMARFAVRQPESTTPPEALAQAFHETYERLAPQFDYSTRVASAVPWSDVPEPNKSLMIAVAAEIASRFSLPEPAEVEWEYKTEIIGADYPVGTPLRRTKEILAGEWVPVKGTEQGGASDD